VFFSSWMVCSWGMLGHTDRLSEELISSNDQILADPVSEFGEDEEESCSEQIVYSASFEELASSSIKYDTVIWLSISLLLVLAWGFGLLMLLYLPFRRYVLRKDLSSRRLYVTHTEVVCKVHMNSSVCTWCCIMSLIEKWFFYFPFSLGQGVKAIIYTILGDHNNWEVFTSFFGDWYYYWTRYWCRPYKIIFLHPTPTFFLKVIVFNYVFPWGLRNTPAHTHLLFKSLKPRLMMFVMSSLISYFLFRLFAVYIWCPHFSGWKYCSWKGCSSRCTTSSRNFWPWPFEKGLIITKGMFLYISASKEDVIIIQNIAIDLQVIITEASKISRDLRKSWNPMAPSIDVENTARMPATTEGPAVLRSSSRSHKVIIVLLNAS